MTEVERDIGLALLKRLFQRELLTEDEYVAACNSRIFDKRRFLHDTGPGNNTLLQEVEDHDDG